MFGFLKTKPVPFETGLLDSGNPLPFVIRPGDPSRRGKKELIKLIEDEQELVQSKTLEHGGVLFRGFAIDDPKAFEKVAQALIPSLKPYVEGQSPRTKIRGNVYTSTEYPKHLKITLHSELSYVKDPPPSLVFFSLVPADKGGETPIVDVRTVYDVMPEELREKFESRQIKYVKNMPASERGLGKTWMDHFEMTDKGEVEKYLADNDIAFEWLADGTLRTETVRPAVRKHPKTGETVWYNQANLWHVTNFEEKRRETLLKICGEEKLPTHCYFGDGSKISKDELDAVRKVMWDNAQIFPWEQGDVLILDNILAAHGRMAFEGDRTTLVAMG